MHVRVSFCVGWGKGYMDLCVARFMHVRVGLKGRGRGVGSQGDFFSLYMHTHTYTYTYLRVSGAREVGQVEGADEHDQEIDDERDGHVEDGADLLCVCCV